MAKVVERYLEQVLLAVDVAVQLLQAGAKLGSLLRQALLSGHLQAGHLALHCLQPFLTPLHHPLHTTCPFEACCCRLVLVQPAELVRLNFTSLIAWICHVVGRQ